MKPNRSRVHRLVLLIAGGCLLGTAPAAGPALASAAPAASAAAVTTHPAVEACGQGAAVKRPSSMILTCADDGELAVGLHWSSWGPARATATGTVTWRVCAAACTLSNRHASASADFTLLNPKTERGKGVLFTRLDMHVTGPTPRGFLRNLAFDEAPLPAASPVRQPRGKLASPPPAAPSGTLDYASIEGFWLAAGGPDGSAGSYTQAQVAAAITGAESSFSPGIIQPGVDYCGSGSDRAGWGLWQITCGNSVPADGTDFNLLDPWNNAEAAVSKCDADVGAGYNCFAPWSTYTSSAYTHYLQNTAPNTLVTDPGEYSQSGSTPPGTPSSPAAAPGSTYGPPIPTSAIGVAVNPSNGNQYTFWPGMNGDINQAYYNSGAWNGPQDMSTKYGWGAGPASSPGAAVANDGTEYVFWRGSGGDIWEAWWNGSWNKQDMTSAHGWGTAQSAPGAAVNPTNDNQYVFWVGANGDIYQAYFSSGSWNGPQDMSTKYGWGAGPASSPGVAVTDSGSEYVFWRGSGGDIWEAWWNGSWNKQDMTSTDSWGTAQSAPAVAVNPANGNQYVFWVGANGDIYQAYFSGGSWNGPQDMHAKYGWGGGPASSPGAAVANDGTEYVFWRGSGGDIWEAWWNGSWNKQDMGWH